MITQGFKNYFKSRSLGNLSINDDNSNDTEDAESSPRLHFRGDKQNLSSINEHKRELHQKLKDFTDMTMRCSSNGYNVDIPYLPECNLEKIKGNVSREFYNHQSAMWELLATEKNFLKQIHFIVEFYISAFELLSKEFFPKINSAEIFSNLKDVYRVSLEFWKECIDPLVNGLLDDQIYLQSHLLKYGFSKIGVILEPYIIYCTEMATCRSRIMTLEKGNELFAEYTKWALNLQQSNRENICDHLTKPVQRLTKYKILLQAIQKYSNYNEKLDIQEMIDSVKCFVTRVNEKVEENALMTKIVTLSKQIESYDVIDPIGDDVLQIVNQYNKFDITVPIMIGDKEVIRQLAHQGELKLREGVSKSIDIKLYLLTDILLITKSKKKTLNKMKIIKPPILLDKIRVQKNSNNSFVCVCLNEFNCISSLYHLSSSDSKKVDEWVQKIEESMKNFTNTKPTFLNEIHNAIPEVKVVQSSPKRNRFKTQSNSDRKYSYESIEFNIKRKSAVVRKHKSRQTNSYYGIDVNEESPPIVRKNSQPTIQSEVNNLMRKLSKSNSFHERDKQSIKQISDSSDVDDSIPIPTRFSQPSILKSSRTENARKVIIEALSFTGNGRSNTAPAYISGELLNKNLSRSLNKLN